MRSLWVDTDSDRCGTCGVELTWGVCDDCWEVCLQGWAGTIEVNGERLEAKTKCDVWGKKVGLFLGPDEDEDWGGANLRDAEPPMPRALADILGL